MSSTSTFTSTLTSNPLILTRPPPLHPTWKSHIPNLPLPIPTSFPTPHLLKATYRQNCASQTALLLHPSSPLHHLTQHLHLTHSFIPSSSPTGHQIPTRLYTPTHLSHPSTPLIIYFHGGGLLVGDLDSEDLTCRALSLSLSTPLLSIAYRLLPEFTADDAVSDALSSYSHLCAQFPNRKFTLVGSSSGGQLAATVALTHLQAGRISVVVLRCPVTCDATDGGTSIPEEWKNIHKSMSEEFYTGILNKAAVTKENRVREYRMPLEMLAEMPKLEEASEIEEVKTKWFIQLCTNDIYYSDGVCLGLGLKERGCDVKMRVEVGWPHTFWLKGMVLEEAQRAEKKLIKGAQWVLCGLDNAEEPGIKEIGVQGASDWVEWSEEVKLWPVS
ncbi:hypothetical protein SBOR_2991 [Sclerotinia borealis F-4128]|uniref:Alpha/beta hydrolase fold-3 domain-containing protein n=1 Tax=Sclerotinia borealis (strain F-4128) TaxID=1432307 RepID=W9CPR2_SCLBF|nr:hypothetical protein SBOR_2991 [Sclerotinia borealis F-4128]